MDNYTRKRKEHEPVNTYLIFADDMDKRFLDELKKRYRSNEVDKFLTDYNYYIKSRLKDTKLEELFDKYASKIDEVVDQLYDNKRAKLFTKLYYEVLKSGSPRAKRAYNELVKSIK